MRRTSIGWMLFGLSVLLKLISDELDGSSQRCLLIVAHRPMFSRAIAATLVIGFAIGISGSRGFASCLRRCAESAIRCTPSMYAAA
jgi:hypothetical protein